MLQGTPKDVILYEHQHNQIDGGQPDLGIQVPIFVSTCIRRDQRLPIEVHTGVTQYVAVLFLMIGAYLLLRSIWSFAHVGKGTLAPFVLVLLVVRVTVVHWLLFCRCEPT